MNKFAKIASLVVGCGLLAFALGQFHPGTGQAAGAAPVMVVNTPLPVDVGMPSVNVANVPTVNLNGVPSMLVANSNAAAVPVRDLDNPDPAANPFQVRLCFTQSPSFSCGSIPISFTVDPTLRGLVIEYVSGLCFTDSTTGVGVVAVGVDTTAGGAFAGHLVVQSSGVVNLGAGNVETFFGQQTRFYADPGSSVELVGGFFVSGSPVPNSFCNVTLSGHTLK